MAQPIVFFLLFILPYIVSPFGLSAENTKVIVGEVGIILLLLISLFFQPKPFSLRNRRTVLYAAIFILTLIDMVFFKTDRSFLGNGIRMQGILLLWFLLVFSFFSSTERIKTVPWFVYAFLLLAEFASLFIMAVDENHRFVGTLGEPNATAAFVLFLWPFSFFAIKKFEKREKWSMLLIFAVVALILILTNSRSAMIAFVIQLVFVLLRKINVSIVKTTLLCMFLCAASYILPFLDNTQFESRAQIWQSGLNANNSNLLNILFGHGFGNMETALHESAKHLGIMVQFAQVDSAHNIFLDWWVQGGVVGILLLVSLMYLSLAKFIKDNRSRELVLLIGMITVLSFNPASFVSLLGFWWLIGQ